MQSLILKPAAQPLYTVRPEQSHPRISLRRVLYVKFLRWVDGASLKALRKAALRLLLLVVLLLLYTVPPHALLLFVYGVAKLKGYLALKILAAVVTVMYWRDLYRVCRRLRSRDPGTNQNSYHGLTYDRIADYLMEHRSFKVEHAMKHLAISQDKHACISKELERHAVLVRGENNARVLNDITREELVRQLKEKFPLVWSEEGKVWAERNGTFERWAMEKDRKEREEQEKVARLERKKDRLKDEIEELKSPFRQVLDLTA